MDLGFLDKPRRSRADEKNHGSKCVGHPLPPFNEIRRNTHRKKHDDATGNHENALSPRQHVSRHAVDVEQRERRILQIGEHQFHQRKAHQRDQRMEKRKEGCRQDDRNGRDKEKRLATTYFGYGVIALPREIHHKKRQEPQVDAPDCGAVGLGPSHFEQAKRHERASNPHGNAPADIREADAKQIPPQQRAIGVIRPKLGSIEQVSFFAEFFRHNFFFCRRELSVGYEQRAQPPPS